MDRYDLLHKEYDLLEHSNVLADVAVDNLNDMLIDYMDDVIGIDIYQEDFNDVLYILINNVITLVYRDRFNN